VPLNVVTVGSPDRPAILFIHGIGQSHYSFHRQLSSELLNEFFLVAFDLRGHAGSAKPWTAQSYNRSEVWGGDIAAIIQSLELKKPLIVAWSYGALVAMDYIRHHDQTSIAGLVMTGSIGALKVFSRPSSLSAEFEQLRELQLSPDPVDNINAARRMVSWLAANEIPEPDRQRYIDISLMLPAYARRAMWDRNFDNRDLVQDLTLPVLIALGEKDNPQSLHAAQELASSRQNLRLSVYQGAGHSVFLEQPGRFNEELQQFARSVFKSAAAPPRR